MEGACVCGFTKYVKGFHVATFIDDPGQNRCVVGCVERLQKTHLPCAIFVVSGLLALDVD